MALQKAQLVLMAMAMMCALSLGTKAQAEDSSDGGSPSAASAQGANAPYEFGLHLGDLLPNQINGVREIMGLGGVRLGFRLSPGSYLETGLISGNGSGQEWKNVAASVRMDIPVENLVGLAYVGADANYYKGPGTSTRLIFGGHVGGGIQAHLTGSTWFRTDMKFSFSPGTSLYFGFGLVWRLGDGGST